MVRVNVNPGICGFMTEIQVNSADMQNAVIEIKTECPNLKPLEQELKEVDGYAECFSKIGTSEVYDAARKYCKHPACPVPTAVVKGIEVACGLALPKDVTITINKEE